MLHLKAFLLSELTCQVSKAGWNASCRKGIKLIICHRPDERYMSVYRPDQAHKLTLAYSVNWVGPSSTSTRCIEQGQASLSPGPTQCTRLVPELALHITCSAHQTITGSHMLHVECARVTLVPALHATCKCARLPLALAPTAMCSVPD